ncbi:retrovirus-related pol polyprotein from transposon TNT 1-94 [Tanacetum coccineum]
MTTLADKSLLSGGDNKPPMLEKHLYDSWKSRMELYMLNRPHGRMILASVEKGPLVWPSITEDGVTRLKEYIELTPAEAIQADCDIKAINIILQGLPTEIYALVSQHRVAKDLWEKIKLLMQGTSLTKQERECKLYDEFDKFTYKKGESLHEYYLRFTLLLNDMNIYKMPLEQFQVNTKFLNTLPDEWSKFVTDVKLVKDLHTTNVDQLHAYLQQHERHANEVRLMHERNSDPLALVASHQLPPSTYQSHLHTLPNSQLQHHVSPYPSSQFVTPYQTQQFTTSQSTPLSITYPSNEYQSSVHHNVYSPQSSIPQLEYAPTTYQHQQSEFSQPDSGLIVPVFQKGDDPIDAINHMMSFLTAVVTSRYPTTNNQLRTSSNPRQQATIYDGKVTVQPVQGRQTTYAAGTTRKYTPGASGSNTGKQRTVICYNCKGEGHISKQCTMPKRKRDETTHNIEKLFERTTRVEDNCDTVTLKRPQDGADDDQEPSARTDRGSKRRRSGKEPESTSAPREKTTTTAGKTTTGSKTHKQSASQSALVEETMQSTDVFEAPAHQEFETGVHDEQPEEEVHPLPDWFQQPKRLPSPDRAWNKFVPAGPTFKLMKGTCKSLTELEYFCEEVYKATTEKLDWINPEGRQYPHDLRKPLPLIPNSQGRHVIPFHHFINNDLEYLRGGESSHKYSTSVTKTKAADYEHIKWIEDLVPKLIFGVIVIVKLRQIRTLGNLTLEEAKSFYAFADQRESARDVTQKDELLLVTKVEIVDGKTIKHHDCILRVEDLHGLLKAIKRKLNTTKPDTDIRMEYLPQTFWSQRDKANARAMIQAIDKRLKTRRIMRSLERFVGGRPYGGDLRLLQRTI